MKQIFTRFICLLLVMGFGLQLPAQLVLEITDPADVAGNYDGGDAAFFVGCFQDVVTGEIVAAVDGSATPTEVCEAIVTDVAGKIALVDRGTCTFEQKTLNAQNAGAIAVIICNNRPGTVDGGGAYGLGDSDEITEEITIPAMGVSQEDCAIFRSALPVMGTIRTSFFDQDVTTRVVWGDQPGQGDFTGGLNGWSTVTLTCRDVPSEYNVWQWTADGKANRGSFASGSGAVLSPTGCTGAMAFDSDFHDNEGLATGGENDPAFGAGPCPAPQVGELISPSIDLSTVDVSGVALSFYQDARQFRSQYMVSYSIDGGETWTDQIINEDIAVNEGIDIQNTFMLIPLVGAAGQSDVRVKFTMEGDYYYWVIDDVQIVEGYSNELAITDVFYTPASRVQPASQVAFDPFYFQADVSNQGTQDQTNVVFKAEVIEVIDNGDDTFSERLVFADSALYEVIPVQVDTSLEIVDLYTPDLTPGTYVIRYSLSQDGGDEVQFNNFDQIVFVVSENTFSKETNGGDDISRNGGDQAHAYACLYSIGADTKEDYVVDNISFRSFSREDDGALDGNTVNVYLLEVSEEVDDALNNFNFESSDITADGQLEFVGFTEYTYPDGSGQDNFFSTPLEDFETGTSKVALKPGSRYFAMTEYPQASAHIFQLYSTETDYRFISGLLLFDRWFSGFAGQNGFGPVIRMDIILDSLATVGIDETPLPDGTMQVFPNPAVDFVDAQFNFEQQLDATVTLATIDGKVIEYKNLPLLKETVTFNTSNLATGMYIMRVATDIGTKTTKFLVKRE